MQNAPGTVGPFGRGWALKDLARRSPSADILLIAYSEGVVAGANGAVTGDVFILDAKTESGLWKS